MLLQQNKEFNENIQQFVLPSIKRNDEAILKIA